MKISVVIPTYQRPNLLNTCLEALLRQTFSSESYEIIVVSDGPDDSTAQVVQTWQKNSAVTIHFLSLTYKRGPAAARNLGWRKSHGELIAFTDDDCIPDTNWLTKIWETYKGEEVIAYSGRVVVPVSQDPTDYELNTAGLETAEFVTANCICSRMALVKVGGFDSQFSTAWREDSDLEFKLLENHIPIKQLPQAIIVHPVRKAPWGVSLKEQRKSMFNALLYKKFPRLYRQKIQPGPVWHYYLIIFCFLGLFCGMLTNSSGLALLFLVGWIGCTGWFTWKRLSRTSKSFWHVSEMIVTSALIPFLSIYWTLYGAWRYRVLFF
ncbi:glycosyltransferase [Xanthocytophaga agilis]|uniref:Glycosyltransferase n=1 Tax=Xanthocytophaga agilis TaxID=3048010 RepID=A0AAE3UCC6_9BACT|nr:glycosyltransferase [Xanthocytophaga agilis]MDJ1499980.1 glycosyltransferase [Xanthocytophaga agilis]